MAKAPTEQETKQYRARVVAFIRWSRNQSPDLSPQVFDDDIAAARKAKTFDEITKILAKHDDGTFMQMVEEGQL